MDSDSRVPFFGLQLGRKKKRPESDIVPLSQSGTPATGTIRADLENEEEEPRRSGLSKLFGRFGKPKRFPLPLTDSQSDGDSTEAIAADMQGLAEF